MSEYRSGVYVIRNKTNGKRYVGSSKDVEGRIRGHLKMLRKNEHYNRHLQHAWNKDGEGSFEFLVQVRCCMESVIRLEQFYIDRYKSAQRQFGYNLSPTAGSCYGVKYSEEQREAMKRTHARPEVIERRRKVRESPEFKELHRQAMQKVFESEEYRRKMSESTRAAHSRPEVKAKHKAALAVATSRPEYREKQRVASTGRKHSPETIAKIVASNTPDVREKKAHNRGKKLSRETRKKMSEGRKACMTEEVSERMSEGARKGWIKRKENLANRAAGRDQFADERLG